MVAVIRKPGEAARLWWPLAGLLALLVAGMSWFAGQVSAAPTPGAVYVLSNQAAGNQVLVFERGPDGTLTPGGAVPTGGLGTGAGLGSQGSLVLTDNGRYLFAVNAGSNDVSSFVVRPSGFTLVDRAPSGGVRPISLSVDGDLLYVLNAGGTGNISGFTIDHGNLAPLAGSTRPLSGPATNPAQVQFSPDGRLLVVTEKATNLIDTYVVDHAGLAQGPVTHASVGVTPFGFAFARRGTLIVSEAATNALSSYDASSTGGLSPITSSASTQQLAPCWVVVTGNSRYAYTTNAHSNSISGFAVSANGSLTALDADGVTATTGAAPTDMALSGNSHFLYAVNSAGQSISAFRVGSDGSLAPIAEVPGLPAGAVGIAAQ